MAAVLGSVALTFGDGEGGRECIKIHGFADIDGNPNFGTESADFTGDNEIGAADGDHHKTLLEWDPEDPNDPEFLEAAAWMREHGPMLNKILNKMKPAGAVGSFMGNLAGFRGGVWPGDGRD